MNRIILHVDMDAFFASVEQKDNPRLKGKPVIVGGIGERGVVSTCSYEARKYGVHSAMPIFLARSKCPMGIFLPVRYYRYREISERVFEIFKEVTPIIEPLSIDEAFLDISNSRFNSGEKAGLYIKERVRKELGLTLSIGISYNKFLAKLASDWNKPNGIMFISENMVPNILKPLPISKVFGLGKKSVGKLNNMGIFTIEDLYELPKDFLQERLGKMGLVVYDRIRGIDNREVETFRERKSVGKERTLRENTSDKDELLGYIKGFSKEVSSILMSKNILGKTVTLKYKTGDFESHTRSKTLNHYICTAEEIYESIKEILEVEELSEDIRLIGISVSSFKETRIEQLSLF
ncbi:DNA polymerase IV [Clostridium sp. SHJSY1]|uniref:DNA polymerase IV n=1 Tax=Clostridium sp. SHJSY1 TaxID=2942483 RepID=UPI002876DBBD|nr:DNA polymerase IV [Clostridium sp. SHJSY1]MDS0524082.1 DNA polymerase IV [Clostridium sp. SHJSY1]